MLLVELFDCKSNAYFIKLGTFRSWLNLIVSRP